MAKRNTVGRDVITFDKPARAFFTGRKGTAEALRMVLTGKGVEVGRLRPSGKSFRLPLGKTMRAGALLPDYELHRIDGLVRQWAGDNRGTVDYRVDPLPGEDGNPFLLPGTPATPEPVNRDASLDELVKCAPEVRPRG